VRIIQTIHRHINTIQRYRIRWMLVIALCWTAIEVVSKIAFTKAGRAPGRIVRDLSAESITIRAIVVLAMSLTIAYVFVFRFKRLYRERPPLQRFIRKALLLVSFAVAGNFLVHISYTIFLLHFNIWDALVAFWDDATRTTYLVERSLSWTITYTLTLLVIEINDKYSPGLFFPIIFGSYANPRIEQRIVMFLDLKDSTPIAEKLGSSRYFLFIRDFIYYVSASLLEHGGSIYQYVGDEAVTSWPATASGARKCLRAVSDARKTLNRKRSYFMRRYGVFPEFRVGIHQGDVTIGEIGIVKKDLAMSGDTMNTAARIRTACSELDKPLLASASFIGLLPARQNVLTLSMGVLELKGKSAGLELFTTPQNGVAANLAVEALDQN
jgi:adenylate cyclase